MSKIDEVKALALAIPPFSFAIKTNVDLGFRSVAGRTSGINFDDPSYEDTLKTWLINPEPSSPGLSIRSDDRFVVIGTGQAETLIYEEGIESVDSLGLWEVRVNLLFQDLNATIWSGGSAGGSWRFDIPACEVTINRFSDDSFVATINGEGTGGINNGVRFPLASLPSGTYIAKNCQLIFIDPKVLVAVQRTDYIFNKP
jgi:hypothetical protein